MPHVRSALLLLLLLPSSAADASLRGAYSELVQSGDGSGKELAAAHLRLGHIYAASGQESSAKFFFEQALRAEPKNPEATAAVEADGGSDETVAERQLATLAVQLFSSGQLQLGLRADLQRLASMHAREQGKDLKRAKEDLNHASLLLLLSGLDSHAISIARHLLASNAVGCAAACEAPPLLQHEGAPHGVSLAATRSFLACCAREANLLELLVTARKADVNQPNDFGYTPLHFAAMFDQPEAVSLLLSRGANASARTMFGHTPLHLGAARNATAGVAALMRDAELVAPALPLTDAAGRTAWRLGCDLGYVRAAELINGGKTCKPPPPLTLDGVVVRLGEPVKCAFDARAAKDTTPSIVIDHLASGRPLIVKGGVAALGEWFAAERWERARLRAALGATRVDVADTPGAGAPPVSMTLADYLAADYSSRAAVVQLFSVTADDSPARGFALPAGSFLDPQYTALEPQRVQLSLGPRGAGAPMRTGRAVLDMLVRGTRTWLLQPPSEATYSTLHPADATRSAPWPYAAETLFSCEQEAGDVVLVPDGWGHAWLNDDEALSFAVNPDVGASEFSISTS